MGDDKEQADSATIKVTGGSIQEIKGQTEEEKPSEKDLAIAVGEEDKIENKKPDSKGPVEINNVMEPKQNGLEVAKEEVCANNSSNETAETKQNGSEVSITDDDVSMLCHP